MNILSLKNKINVLHKLEKEVKKCRRCPLYKTARKKVFGEGPANAKIMLIGEAAGRLESIQGRPFVGPAGKFLNKLFELANINRKKIFITSVLKCRPVLDNRNRKPTKEEIDACFPYLKKQIEIIDPQKFILLGEVAFSVFFPKKELSSFRGKWVKKEDKEYFITYHPAAGLRFPKIKKILEKDFQKLRNLTKKRKKY